MESASLKPDISLNIYEVLPSNKKPYALKKTHHFLCLKCLVMVRSWISEKKLDLPRPCHELLFAIRCCPPQAKFHLCSFST